MFFAVGESIINTQKRNNKQYIRQQNLVTKGLRLDDLLAIIENF